MFKLKLDQYPVITEVRLSFLEGHITATHAFPSQWTHNRPTIHLIWRKKRSDASPSRPPVLGYMCFIYPPRDAKERKAVETLLNAAIWFEIGFDRDTGERLEHILDNLPPPPARKPKSTWPEMSTTEKLGNIADRGSDIFDEVF